MTPGTERTLESAGDIEASSSGCQESAGETRTVCMKGLVAEKKPRRKPKVGKKDCPICGQTVTILKRHVEAEHLPWYFSPELAGWQCRFAEETTMKLWGRRSPASQQRSRERSPSPGRGGCYNCGQEGHFVKDCPSDFHCYNCGKSGHMNRECPLRGSSQRKLPSRDHQGSDSAVFKRLEGGNSGLGPTLRFITVDRPAQNTNASSQYDTCKVQQGIYVHQMSTHDTHDMGTEATSVCAVSIADNGSPCSVRVEQGTNGDTTVIEGVRDFAEVPIHDMAGTYAAEHHTHRFSGNPLHTEHPSKDMHDTVSTSASQGNSGRELVNTQGIDKKQGVLIKRRQVQ